MVNPTTCFKFHLCYLVRGAPDLCDSIFYISIDYENIVDELRQAIRKNQLSLWAVDLCLDDRLVLGTKNLTLRCL